MAFSPSAETSSKAQALTAARSTKQASNIISCHAEVKARLIWMGIASLKTFPLSPTTK